MTSHRRRLALNVPATAGPVRPGAVPQLGTARGLRPVSSVASGSATPVLAAMPVPSPHAHERGAKDDIRQRFRRLGAFETHWKGARGVILTMGQLGRRDSLAALGHGVVTQAGAVAEVMHRDWFFASEKSPAESTSAWKERQQRILDWMIVAERRFHQKFAALQADIFDVAQRSGLFDTLDGKVIRSHAILFSPHQLSVGPGRRRPGFNAAPKRALREFLNGRDGEGKTRRTKLFPPCTQIHVDLKKRVAYALVIDTDPQGKKRRVAVKMPCKLPSTKAAKGKHALGRLRHYFGNRSNGRAKARVSSSGSSPVYHRFNARVGWNQIGSADPTRMPRNYTYKGARFRIPSDKANVYGPTIHRIRTPERVMRRGKFVGHTPGERLHGAPADLKSNPADALASLTNDEGLREVGPDDVQGCVYLAPRDAIWLQMCVGSGTGRPRFSCANSGPTFKYDILVNDYGASL